MKTDVVVLIRGTGFGFVSSLALATSQPAFAQDADDSAEDAVVPVRDSADRKVYVPENFTRFAPRNALDMLENIPGFTVQSQDQGRGFGQANENVLIDGERVSSKSESAAERLSRTPADRVVRIELVDGANMGIPGLSGQVANVILKKGGIAGQFEYRAFWRPNYALDSYGSGEVSVSGSSTNFEWNLTASHGVGRGGAGGGDGTFIYDAAGELTETRESLIWFKAERPGISGRIKWDSPGGLVANLNASYQRNYTKFNHDEWRHPIGGVDQFRDFLNQDDGYEYDISGDIQFPLGSGELKLIGIERFTQGAGPATSILSFADNSPSVGSRFFTDIESGERIGRAEYSWAMLGDDWQLDAEAAFNRHNQVATLGTLDPMGAFDDQPYPAGSGRVTEERYETILTHNRTLTDGLTLQVGAGGEYSKLAQSGANGLTREFWRPKGSVTLAWSPSSDIDVSLKLARTVGQLSFGTFLGNVNLQDQNANAGNVELVPQQAWEANLEVQKDLGAWGSVTVEGYVQLIEDYIDIIPVNGGESSGNIDGKARLFGLRADATIDLDPIGWKGARITSETTYEATSLPDPLTGEDRPFSGIENFRSENTLRWDVPSSDWAFGVGASITDTEPYVRLFETGRSWEGPVYTFAFIEHKDVLGMTVNLQAFNLQTGNAYFQRTVYDGLRDRSPVLFIEDRKNDVSTIYRLRITGSF